LVSRAADLAGRIAQFPFERGSIADGLERSLRSAGAPDESAAAARSLRSANATIVITGQQPGFLGGPLFTLFKAAHAVALARAIASITKNPCVAAFWNHSDDHDLDETRGLWLPDAAGELHRLSLDLGRGRPFLSDVVVPANAKELCDRTAALLPGGPSREELLSLVLPRAGERFAAATTRMLLGLLGKSGLVVFEPRDLRSLLSSRLARVVRDTEGSLARLAEHQRSIRARGLEPPFDDADPAILFERTAAGRERVRFSEHQYSLPSGARLSPEKLAARIEAEPDSFTAGVASRCAVEALALPVVATVRGPGELIYTPSAYCFLPPGEGRAAPVEIPRFSATLLEPKVEAILEQYHISPEELLRSPREAEAKIPPQPAHEAERALERLESAIQTQLSALEGPLKELDANLERPLQKTAATAASAVGALRARVRRSVDEKSALGAARFRRAAAWLAPRGELQERMLPSAPFLCFDAAARVAELVNAIEPAPSSHRILSFRASG
jgi:bacillithiol biosynthesis cysteine-adding enzyme BshC